MIRTSTSFSLLQAIAAAVSLAILLWAAGFPALRFAEAANVTTFSDTLSDSAPGVVSNHTISFVTPSGMATSSTISLGFPVGFDGIDNLVAQDLDLNVNGVERSLIDGAASGADWNVTAAGQVIDLTSDTDVIASNATVTIRIGTNAISGGTGTNQIENPGVGQYEITVDVGGVDSGTTMVAIVAAVTVSATVETRFDFTVDGVNSGELVNGDTVTATSSNNSIPFGVLVANTQATAAHDLTISTNAANGFVVTVHTDQQLTAGNGADIDGFVDGSYTTTPVAWTGPTPVFGSENTYGHWGITTNDDTTSPALTQVFGSQEYVSASTTPVEIFRHNGPTDGTTQGVGITRVGYSVEISDLQEAANDYTATLTYVATPVF